MKKPLLFLSIVLLAFAPTLVYGQASGHSTTAAYITTDSEPWGQNSNIEALNAVYGSSGWNKYTYGTNANNNVSNIFSNTRSLVFIEGGNANTIAMRDFLNANWSTIQTWISGGRTLIVNAATNQSLGEFQIGTSGVYSNFALTNNMVAYSNAATYPNTTSNVHPLLRTNVTINGVTGDAYFSGNYYGNYVAHNVIYEKGTSTLKSIFTVSGQTTQYTLAEKEIGSGRMLVGGLTLPWFITVTAWQPQPQMTRFMYAMLGWVQAVSNPAPSISTTAFSNLGTSSVTTGGNSINANGETITAKGVAYATSQNPTTSNSTVSGGSGTANFTVNITGLSPNTLYYARAYAISPTGTGYGSQISFRTLPINPTSATSSATNNTICSGTFTNLSVSNAQGTVYWYTDANRTNFVGTGNPRSVNPSVTTTYYAWNYNGNFSTGSTSVTITVNQPASQPATASVTVPSGLDGLTKANLSWAASTGDGTITYEWAVGTSSTVNYDAGYTSRGTTTSLSAEATGLSQSTGYYLAVRAKNGCGTSVNRVSSIFRTNNQRTYVAGANGTVGTTSAGGDASVVQYTAYNTNGTEIYAVPNTGYNFVNWSDGVTANPRTDNNVITSVTLTANFAPNRLAFVAQPGTLRAGAEQTITVEITDTYGNRMTNSTAAVTLSFQNNPSVGGAGKFSGTDATITVNATAGLATFSNVWIDKTGNGYTLKASSPAPIVTEPVSSAFNIIPAANVNYFTLVGIITPHEAGSFTSPTVTAYDQYDNVKYDYTGTVSFSTNNSSPNPLKPTVLPANYTFTSSDNGVKTFTNGVNLKQYGSGYYVRVNDGAAQGEQTGIHVSSAPLNFYTIVANPDGNGNQQDVKAGTAFTVLAKLFDEFGNMKLDFNGQLGITFTTNANPSPLGNPPVIPAAGNQTFTAGSSVISGFTFYNAQETPVITITETLTASAGTTPPITVWPEVLHNFLVQKDPLCTHTLGGVRVTAGDNFSVKVTARDRYNNIKRDYIGNVNFKSSNDNIVVYPTGLQAFNAGHQGIRIFNNIRIPTTGAYWLRVGDSPDAFKTGTLENIIVAPGVQNASNTELFFTNHPTVTTYPVTPEVIAGDFISVTIRPRDAGNNLLCDCQDVKVYLNGIDTHRNGAAVNGIPSLVTIPVTDNHDGTYSAMVRVTDMSVTNQITATVNETPINVTLQVIIQQPDQPSLIVSTFVSALGSITTDENTTLTLRLFDQFGNKRTTNDGVIRFTTTEGGFAANNGVKTNYTANYIGNGDYTAVLYASYDATTHGVGSAVITATADFTDVMFTDGGFDASPVVTITEGLPNLETSVITANPTSITTDGSSTIAVQMKDHLGNLIQNNRGTVSLSATIGSLTAVTNNGDGTYNATLTGDTRGLNGTGTSIITGSFTGSGTASGVTGDFVDDAEVLITEGLPALAQIDISTDQSAITADESTTVTVQLKDQFGNLIVNNRGVVSLSVSPIGVIDNGTTTGSADIAAVYQSNGAYTATFKLNAAGVGNATITGKLDGNAIVDNAVVNVLPGAATQLAMHVQPAHITTQGIAGIAFTTQPQVSIQDQWGNIVTDNNATVIQAQRGSIGSESLLGTLSATASGGIATFSGLNYQKAEDMNILFTSGSLESVSSLTVSIVHNVPAYMTISGSEDQIAGTSQEITVRVYDTYGNAAIRFVGNKSLVFSGAGNSPAPPYYPTVSGSVFGNTTSLNFAAGVATGDMTLYKEETAYILATHNDAVFSDPYTGAANLGIAATNPNGLEVEVGQAAPAYLAITGVGTQIAGTSQIITITAYDIFNNPATNYTGTKQIRFGGASVSNAPSTTPSIGDIDFGTDTELVFTNGVASGNMWLYKVENAVIIATDYTSGSAGITTPANNTVGQTTYVYQLPVAVLPATASYLAVTGSGTQTAGASQTITITAYDSWNNVATDYAGNHGILFSGASSSPDSPKAAVHPAVNTTDFGSTTNLNFTLGVATASMILTKVETAYVKASDGVIHTDDDYDLHVEVNHATNNYFAVTGNSSQTAGVAQIITVTMYDAYNNIATSYTGDKSLTFSGASASFYGNNPTVNSTVFGDATTVAFTNGVASTASMILTAALNTTVTVSGDAINTASGLGLTVDVNHNIATNLRIDQQPSSYVRAGNPLEVQPEISIRDAYGNIAITDNTTLITASANGTVGNELFGTRTLTAIDGVVSYTDLSYRLMETITIGFTSSPVLTAATSHNIQVDHNATARFAFTAQPGFIIVGGQRGAYTVTRYDAYNNLVNNVVNTNGTDNNTPETVYLYTNGSITNPFVSTFHNAQISGSIITSVDIAHAATSANFWYYSTHAGEHLITGSDKASLDNPDQDVTNAVHNTLEVRPAALSHFIVSGIGTPVGEGWTEHYYGDRQTVTVEAIDILGNRKTNYNGTITFNLTDGLAVVGSNYPSDYTFTVGENSDNGIHTFTDAILFTRPSFEHPSYPTVNEWWVTAVDMAQPTKYGSQVKIKVLARPITITAHNQTKYYYGETHNLGTSAFTVSSGVGVNAAVYAGNESISSVQLSSAGTVATATVGNYAIVASNPTPANNLNLNYYIISYVNGTLSVERRPITIATTGTQSKVYGENDPTSFGFSVTSAMGITAWDQWSGVLRREAGENVGLYDMLISGSSLTIVESANPNVNKADNYDISFVNTNQFAITRRPITVNPVADQQKTYGDVNPVYTYTTAADAIGSQLPNGHVVGLGGALARESGENAGTYKILQGTVDNTQNPNYDISFTQDVLFTINRLPIAVTANNGQTKVYGQLDPLPFGYTANPAIGHELANGLLVSLGGTLSRVSGEDVGLYAIQQNTIDNITNPNYEVSFNSNNFEITRLDIALTPNAGQKKIYGQTDPVPFTYTTVPAINTELANGIQVDLSGTLTRDAGEVVGFYNLLQGNVDNATNTNYNISFTSNVKFEIERKDIVINVNGNQSKVYGNTDPVYTYTSNPAVGDLPFNAAFLGALVRETGENVAADYTISQGSLELGDINNATGSLAQNYNVTFNNADFAITRKAIAITVNPAQSKVYGENDPAYTFTSIPALASLPFQAASWTGALVRETGEVVNNEYTISQGTLELIDGQNQAGGSLERNYEVSFTGADFEITRKPITINVTAAAKTYGDNDPAFTFTSNPALAALPFDASWTGNLVRLNTNENVAAYAITQGSLELTDVNNATASLAQNYEVTFVGSNLTINKRNITIAVDAGQNKVYAENDPVFTYNSSVDPLFFNGVFTGVLTRASGENVADNYAIGRGSLQIVDDNNVTSMDDNYTLNFVPANFEITRKPITITVVAGQNKRYGFDDPTSNPVAPNYFRGFEFVSSVEPLPFGGEFIGVLQHSGSSSSPVGVYPIGRGTLNISDDNNTTTSLDANYDINIIGSDFTINERLVTLIAADQTKTYGFGPEWGVGQPDYWTLGSSGFSVSANQGDGLAYSEAITGVQFSSTGESRFAFTGNYGISIIDGSAVGSNGFVLSNYAFSYEGAELTVIPRVLNLSNFAADNKVYDGNTVATGLGFNDNRVPGDNLAFTRTADFEDAGVGINKTVVYNSIIISGGVHKDNYVLESNTAHWKTAANRSITRKPLTITANTFTKYFGEAYTFAGTEFTTSEMVTGEAIQTVTLESDGSPAGAVIGAHTIVISSPVAAAGTLLTNYEIVLQNGIMHVVDPMTISGKVYYYQKFSFVGGNPVRQDLPMQGVTVKLHHNGGVNTTTTNADGEYTFTMVNPSTVTKVEVETSLPWGNVSANDALAMQLKLVQTPPSYWTAPYNVDFMDYIADVNNSGNLSIQDVLGTKYRILYPNDFMFPAGNWRFFADDVQFMPLNRESDNSASLPNPVLTGGFYPNIYARVVGDMDGDYNPNQAKSLIPIQDGEAVVVNVGELFGLDIRLKDALDFAAMSLILQFDDNKIQVESITSALPGFEYRIDGHEIRVVWTSLSGLQLNANDLLLKLNMKTIAPVYWYDNVLFLNSTSVFGDLFANMIGNVAIVAPRIENTVTSLIGFDEDKLSMRAYPNPFNDWVNLSINVPAQAEITITLVDLMGVTVKELLSKEHLSGNYTYRFSAKQHNLAMGVYYVRMQVVANGKSYVRIQRLVHVD